MVLARPKLAVVERPEGELARARRLMRHLRRHGVRPVAVAPLASAATVNPPRPSPLFGVLVRLHVRNTTP